VGFPVLSWDQLLGAGSRLRQTPSSVRQPTVGPSCGRTVIPSNYSGGSFTTQVGITRSSSGTSASTTGSEAIPCATRSPVGVATASTADKQPACTSAPWDRARFSWSAWSTPRSTNLGTDQGLDETEITTDRIPDHPTAGNQLRIGGGPPPGGGGGGPYTVGSTHPA
jgi:hypothetical protein